MSQKNATIVKSGVQRLRSKARSGWKWLAGSWKRPVLLGALVCLAGGGAYLALHGAPDWEALDDVKDAVGTKASLAELKARVKRDPKDAGAWIDLGHEQYDSKNRAGAMRSYGKALRLDATLASTRVLENLAGCYGEGCQSAAHELIVRHKLLGAEPLLSPLTGNKRYGVRYGAINTLEKLGRASNAEYLKVWTMDLTSSECDVRRNGVERLGKLGDRRALDEIRAAKKKEEAETKWYQPSCLGGMAKDAEAQILAKK